MDFVVRDVKKLLIPILIFILVACSSAPEDLELSQESFVDADIIDQTATSVPTETSTATATITPVPSATPTATPVPNHPTDRIVHHAPNESIIYDWYTYVPTGLSKESTNYILLTGISGALSDYENAISTARLMLHERVRWPDIDNFILLAPVIPRRDSPHVYPVAFDLNSFNVRDAFYYRADLKVIHMVDKLIEELAIDGFEVSRQVLIEGYSSGGMFAQRFALLHPDRVQAIAAGQCGGNFILPLVEYDG